MKTIKLGEIAEIIGGQIMTRVKTESQNEETSETVKVIVPKAIEEIGFINPDMLAEESIRTKIDERKTAHNGDIIIKLNAPYDCGIVDENTVGAVVPSFCARIVINRTQFNTNKLIPEYLLAFLNSRRCRKQIERLVQGSVMGVVSVGRLKDIEVPLPAVEHQFSIGNNYGNTQWRLRILKEILQLEQMNNDAVFNELESQYGD